MTALLNSLLPYAAIILGFGFIIFVHELGHFLVAKAVGIKCTQFAIGFGHCLLSYRKGIGFRMGTTEAEYEKRLKEATDVDSLGETEYRFNWMPLGGYVKMLGQEDLAPAATSSDPRAFNRKPIWARACVISAGVVMNLIFGILFFVIAFTVGVDFPPPVVGQVNPSGAAAEAFPVEHPTDPAWQGLRPGDRITHVNGEPVTDMMQVSIKAALSSRGRALILKVKREGVPKLLTFRIKPKVDIRPPYLLSIGIDPPMSLRVQSSHEKWRLPALLREAGVEPGMRVVEVDHKPVHRFDQFLDGLVQARGAPVSVQFKNMKTGKAVDVLLNAQPQLTYDASSHVIHLAGFMPVTRITNIVPGSAAQDAGILPGDIIAELGPMQWPSIHDISEIVHGKANTSSDQNAPFLSLQVLRGNKKIDLGTIQPRKGQLGIYMSMATGLPLVSRTLDHTPAASLNLTAGSAIKSINEHPINSFSDMQRWLSLICKNSQGPIDLQVGFELNVKGKPHFVQKMTLDAQTVKQLARANWTLPAILGARGSAVFEMLKHRVQANTPAQAISLGVDKTHQFMLQTYVTLARLFQGTVKPKHLRGPIGIVHEGTRIAKQGWPYLMFFLGLISINLVVINFLPIPIVDGGLMVFLLIEKVKGSPVSARIQTAAMVVGLVLIASVFLVTLWYDVGRIDMFKQLFGKLF